MPRKKFWEFKNIAPGSAELMLYGEIQSERSWLGDEGGIYADEFVQELNALGAVSQITCRINSVGGDIFAAVAIYTQLKTNAAKIICIIDGLSASAATLIMMAADEIQVLMGSMIMIHDPLTTLCGMYQADELTEQVTTLNTIKDSIVAIYADRTGASEAKIGTLMANTTWMTADDAITLGFADTKIDGQIDAQMKGKVLIMNKIEHDLSGLEVMPVLQHAKNITNAIASNKLISDFVATASKKKAAAVDPDDPDGDEDPDGEDDGNGDDGDGDGTPDNKAKAKAKATAKDNSVATDDTTDEDKGKKAKNVVKNLMNKYPNAINRIVNQAKAEERERIQQIDNISNQVNPELAAKAKYADIATAKDLLYENAIASQVKASAQSSAYLNSFKNNTATSGVKDVGAIPNAFGETSDEDMRSNMGSAIAKFANKVVGRR